MSVDEPSLGKDSHRPVQRRQSRNSSASSSSVKSVSDMGEASEDKRDNNATIGRSTQKSKTNDDQTEDQVLIERNGKFILVHLNDLTVAEKEMYHAMSSSTIKNDYCAPSSKRKSSVALTALSSKTDAQKTEISKRSTTRSKSAHCTAQDKPAINYKDPVERRVTTGIYRLSAEEKMQLAVERSEREKREKEENQRKKEDEERKAAEASQAFEVWLKKKREEALQRRQKEKDMDSDAVDKNEDRESAFNEWVKLKKEQKKQEEKMLREKERYLSEMRSDKSKQDSEEAFKNWLRKKRQDEKQQYEMNNRLRQQQHRSRKTFKP